jgi:hypothetical protein
MGFLPKRSGIDVLVDVAPLPRLGTKLQDFEGGG